MKSDTSDNFPHKELTYKLIGALFKVHNFLGNSLEERYYHRALKTELSDLGIKFETEKDINLLYKGNIIGKHRLDFVVEGNVILELKTLPYLDSKCTTQLLAYLKSTMLHVGLLANFRTDKLTYKRIVNPLLKTQTSDKSDQI